ncbi:hypothetical protein N7495_005236 [Penicillium taxi]|uniref:uncharacterized protein n=1 Tax=Penicillium taxi TaxID=168475 RepID=UPI002545140D|nr:uncharacterized protein N7495_005236 [Penicillium taxi]KAJ5893545.1 hypothetical protein N7495_005236 [Penicillium taxi]
MATPNTNSRQASYTSYDDYVRSEYAEFISPATAALKTHWLQAVLNPFQEPSFNEEIFDQAFGISLL